MSSSDMILVGLGSNLPFCRAAPAETIERALAALDRLGAVEKRSPLYGSPAWPDPNDPPFVNAVAVLSVTIGPADLLKVLQAIEAAFGRFRDRPNAPRTLDLDLLAYGDDVLDTARLKLPHPRLHERDFVLAPLCDIAPAWRHPVIGETAEALLAGLPERTAKRLADDAS